MTAGSSSKYDIENLQYIIKYCEDIDYLIQLHGTDETDFQEISLQYGCVFALSQIGEYAKRISSELKDSYPQIEWKSIAGLRDVIVHNYEDINVRRVRSTVLNRIPQLESECKSILADLRSKYVLE